MEGLPDLLTVLAGHCTPIRRRTLMQLDTTTSEAIRASVTSCAVKLARAEVSLPALPPLRRFPRLQSVQVRCTWAQMSVLFGPPGLVQLSGLGKHGTLQAEAPADAYGFIHTCTVRGATSVSFCLAFQPETDFACSLTDRCEGLLHASFLSLRPEAALSLRRLANPTVERLRLDAVGVAAIMLPNVREVDLRDHQGEVRIDKAACVLRHAVDVFISSAFIASFTASCQFLVRLCLCSGASAWFHAGSLPSLCELSLQGVDVTFGALETALPAVQDIILTDSRVLGHSPRQLARAADSHPSLNAFDMCLNNPHPTELALWRAVLHTLPTRKRMSGGCRPSGVSVFIGEED